MDRETSALLKAAKAVARQISREASVRQARESPGGVTPVYLTGRQALALLDAVDRVEKARMDRAFDRADAFLAKHPIPLTYDSDAPEIVGLTVAPGAGKEDERNG